MVSGLAVFIAMSRQVNRHKKEALEARAELCAAEQMLENERLSGEKRLLDKENACDKFVSQTIRTLEEKFANIASESLALKTKDLSKNNSEQLNQILEPLKEQMDAFRRAANEAQAANTKIGSEIKGQIDSIQQTARNLGEKAEGLAHALQGGNKIQGNWGEKILHAVLESGGLKAGVHFVEQEGSRAVGIPDVKVFDPSGRVLVIDSKTSLTDYVDACNAADEDLRLQKLKFHVESVKRHICELANKDYIEKLQRDDPSHVYLKTVAMFVPNEGAHAAAVSVEPSLIQFAIDRGVVIVTPFTLIAYLRLVSLAWQQDQVDKNHEKIIQQAKILLTRVDGCLKEFEDLGSSLQKSSEQYEKVMGLIGSRDGKQNIIKPANELVKLGTRLEKAKSNALRRNMESIEELS